MDNLTHTIYFSYGPGLAANRQYYRYKPGGKSLSMFKAPLQSQEFMTFKNMKKFGKWIQNSLDDSPDKMDYQRIIRAVGSAELPGAYKSYLMATYYDKLKDKDGVFGSLKDYLNAAENYPEAYVFAADMYHKYKDYEEAVSVLNQLLLMRRITPWDEYRAYRELTKNYLRFEDQSTAREAANKYYQKFLELSGNYFIDERVEKEIEELKKLMEKDND